MIKRRRDGTLHELCCGQVASFLFFDGTETEAAKQKQERGKDCGGLTKCLRLRVFCMWVNQRILMPLRKVSIFCKSLTDITEYAEIKVLSE